MALQALAQHLQFPTNFKIKNGRLGVERSTKWPNLKMCLNHVLSHCNFYGSAKNHLGAGIWVGWLVGRSVCLSVSTQISKQEATLPKHIPACRSELCMNPCVVKKCLLRGLGGGSGRLTKSCSNPKSYISKKCLKYSCYYWEVISGFWFRGT